MKTKLGEREKLRTQILKDSIRTFKKMGKDGAPVDQVMKRAGLTSGALYSHFKGKDDLFFQAVLYDVDRIILKYKNEISKADRKGLKRLIDYYLSPEHIKDIEGGGLYAALSPELSRMPSRKRKVIEKKYEDFIEILAHGLPAALGAERKRTAQLIFAIMLGSLQTARIFYPSITAKRILSQAKEQIERMIVLKKG